MIFAYHQNTGDKIINIDGDLFRHLFLARRHKIGQILKFSALDDKITNYKIDTIDKKSAQLSLISSKSVSCQNTKKLHIGWSIIDNSVIKATLPYLNQLGVDKITFIDSNRSQKSQLNFAKLTKVLIKSSQQCGRLNLMKLAIADSMNNFVNVNKETFLLNFNAQSINKIQDDINTIVIGAEGGISDDEADLFQTNKTVSLNCDYVLKSENAAITIAAKLLA